MFSTTLQKTPRAFGSRWIKGGRKRQKLGDTSEGLDCNQISLPYEVVAVEGVRAPKKADVENRASIERLLEEAKNSSKFCLDTVRLSWRKDC